MIHTIVRQYKDRGETLSNGTGEAPNGNGEAIFDQVVSLGTDVHYDFKVKRAELLAVAIKANQDCTVATNGTAFGSPPTATDVITLKANRVYVWTLDQDGLFAGPGKVTCPFSADVTGLYITALASPPGVTQVQIKTLLTL